VLVLQKGKQIYFGPVTALTSDHGYFELDATDVAALKEALQNNKHIKTMEQQGALVLAYPNEALEIETLSKALTNKGIVLTHLAQKHKSLEEQFLTLTKKNKA
jgi:ABC-2 type transport system ATP-binding protein